MAKKTKQPVGKGVAKVPVVIQLEALECGAACLTMILAYYNKWIPLEQIRADCGVSRDGSNAKNMLRAARRYGLEAKGYRIEPQALREQGTFPCVIHWNFNHFVVLNGFRGNRAYLNDPARGSYSVTMEQFDEAFTGICMTFAPTDAFVPSGHKVRMFAFAKKRLVGTGPAIVFAVLIAIITALLGLVKPAFARIFFDRLLTQQNPEWAGPFLLALALFSLVMIVTSGLSAIYNLRISGKMAAVGSAGYLWKVLRMPMVFFSQRMAGDIQSRQETNAEIANTLINIFAPLVINAGMTVFYLVVMLRYSWILTLIGLGSLAINACVSRLISAKRVNITRVAMRDSAKLEAYTAAGVEMIETIKSSGAEGGFFAKWAGYQANVNAQQLRYLEIEHYLGAIPMLVSNLANYAVLVAGVYLAMNGRFTVGMITAFQSFLMSFMAPTSMFISAGQTLQEMRTEMERVDDVMEYPVDDVLSEDEPEEGGFEKLSGSVELRDLTFGYSPLGQPVIRDFSLTLAPGKSVAIVGATGCGKSTIAKLISGLYRPWSGEILFDGKPIGEIPRSVFYGSLAVVDQESVIFEDTIENNIKMWDGSIEDFEMILAARDAQLHDEIIQRTDGYRHRLLEGGKDLSGGERQRMEIARVLAQDPTIVVLDEATSALDARTEHEVVKAIRGRGISCIVVAHRLSTIRSCDEIIVMSEGKIADRGTHEELMAASELYRALVTSE